MQFPLVMTDQSVQTPAAGWTNTTEVTEAPEKTTTNQTKKSAGILEA